MKETWFPINGVASPDRYGYNVMVPQIATDEFNLNVGYVKSDTASYLGLRVLWPSDWAVKFIIGLAVALIVFFMRGRFTWFRVSLAGIVLGCMFGREIWSPFLIALLIKYLTIRMGGVKLYNEKLRPLSVGLIAGWCIVTVIAILMVWYNAFMPTY
jgi:hypothetical protein